MITLNVYKEYKLHTNRRKYSTSQKMMAKTQIVTITLFLTLHSTSSRTILTASSKKLQDFNVTEYVVQQGYSFEIHKNIQTEDEYLLDIFRIPTGKYGKSPNRPVVLLMHGLGAAGDSFIIGGPYHSLAFLLADKGYDVWIGNARGTSHSKKHVNWDPDKNQGQYWNFSWHEIGLYDLSAMMNYILNTTQQSDLSYIGHSQGCTAFFVLMSTRPVMNQFVKMMIALAPAVFGDPRLVVRPQALAFTIFHQLDVFRQILGIHMNVAPQIKELACNSQVSTSQICDIYFSMVNGIFGFDPSRTRPEHWALIQQTVPDSSSAKQSFHYMQNTLTGDFRQYHLGDDENLKKYGSELPPLYNLSLTSAPVALFWGEKDTQALPQSVKKLGTVLPKVLARNEVPGFAHADFLASDAATELVYEEIFALLYNFSK